MKIRSDWLIAEQAKQYDHAYSLVKIGTDCYTDCNEEIEHNGDTYQPWGVRIEGFRKRRGGMLDNGAIELDAIDQTIISSILNNVWKNASVYIYRVWFDEDNKVTAVEERMSGKVEGRPGFNETGVVVSVVPHINPWNRRCPSYRITIKNFPGLPKRGQKIVWQGGVIEIG